MKFKKILAVGLATLSLTALFGCAPKNENELFMYDGTYSEERLVNYMVKLLVEENTDLTVTIKEQMTSVNAFRELTAEKPSCDLLNAYDGTLLTTFLHLDPTDVPEGTSIYDYANSVAMERHKVRLLGKLGTDNTYAVAVPETIAEKYKLKTVSDLIPVAGELVFGAEHEFFSQEGSMKYGPFTEFYGLKFKNRVTVDLGLKYIGIENGNFDVTEVYATDGLNRKAKLKVLEDDKEFFPDYNGAILARDEIFEKYGKVAPNLEKTLNLLEGQISNEEMTDMTYAVDVEGKDVKDVAKDFLTNKGIIKA
ncbi:MAG: glycine betaine ABC transporter substrate-binding protein [Oscillospiraceae bacterium]